MRIVEREEDLYLKYPNQCEPQPALLYFDPEENKVYCEPKYETGNSISVKEYHNRLFSWTIPPLTAAAANNLMKDNGLSACIRRLRFS